MLEGIFATLTIFNVVFAGLGVFLGIIIGAIPGLTATFGIALLIPITFIMSTEHGMIMLVGIYAGAIYGGSISAILLNIPGTPASIVSGWEGNAMARRGEAPKALGISAVGAGLGGLIASLALALMTPTLARLALSFGAPEYVMLVIFSLIVVVIMLDTPIFANVSSAFIGLTMAAVGLSPVTGAPRLTFGFYQLYSGLGIVAVLIGFFCLPPAVALAIEAIRGQKDLPVGHVGASRARDVWRRVVVDRWLLLRSSLIGIGLGILPAIGPESTPLVAHAVSRRMSRHPEEFGKGSESGLLTADSSISANVGGSLIPLLALGIPGSGAAAVFIGALTLHGLQPGPLLFIEETELMHSFFGGYMIVNLMIIVMGFFGARYLALLLRMPKATIATFITLFSIFGAYAVNNTLFDVWVMLGSALLAVLMRLTGTPILPAVLAFILGGLLESNLGIVLARESRLEYLADRPISLALLLICVALIAWTIWQRAIRTPGKSAK